jgi:hypothetical protein
MLRIKPRLAFINGVLLENRVLIFRFQLLAVYVLLDTSTYVVSAVLEINGIHEV